MAEDLYNVLGVTRSSSDAEIKKSYRTLARKYHPDVNKDAGAEAKFKNIQKSYDILSDPQKKSQYDQYGIADDSPGGGGGFEGFGGGGAGFGGLDDIFETFFGGQGGGRRGGGRRGPVQGEDLRYDLDITLAEAASGLNKDIHVYHMARCGTCEGGGAQPGSSKKTCGQCNGAGQVRTVQRTMLGSFQQVTTCPACHGEGETIDKPCTNCYGKGVEKKSKTLNVDIPAGVDRGSKIRISNEGNAGEGGGPSGDLYIYINVKRHEYFEREQNDLYLDLTIPMTQAVLGTEIEVPLIKGSAKLKIPSGTQSNTLFKLKNKGIPHVRGYGQGDLFVRIHVNTPSVNSKEKTLIKELAALRGDDKEPSDIYTRVKRR